jgi:predicted nucleic acid-binding protein
VIFVDTSFWVALMLEPDQAHESATRLFLRHADTPLATSNLVCGETWTVVRRRFGHRAAVAVVDRLERTPRLQIVRVGRDDESGAWSWLRRHDEREYSFVDATSFAVMRRLAIHEALSFDGYFAAAGFVALQP